MDEPTRLRQRRAHANHYEDCVCGRRLHGNGRRSHMRACPDYLRRYGWPLTDAWRSTLLAELGAGMISTRRSGEVIAEVQRRLGERELAVRAGGAGRVSVGLLPSGAFRDLVWEHVAAVVAEYEAAGA